MTTAVATQVVESGVERWICKHCALTVMLNPEKWQKHGRCPDCGYVEWHHTAAPAPRV